MIKQTLNTNRITPNNQIQTNLKIKQPIVAGVVKNATKVLSRIDDNLSFSTLDELIGLLNTLPQLSQDKAEKSHPKVEENYKVAIVVKSRQELKEIESVAEVIQKFGITYKISVIADNNFVAFTQFAKTQGFEVVISTSQMKGNALPVVRIVKNERSAGINAALNAIRILAITNPAVRNKLNLLSKRKQQFSSTQPAIFINN